MKKIIFLIILLLPIQSLADNIRDFQIEGMSIGDSALDYFNEAKLLDGEQGWHNYNYNEYSTSLVPGKNIYDWFLVTYKSDDDNFTIEALVGGIEKTNYDDKECNNELNATALSMSKLFKNTKQNRKKYELSAKDSRAYPFTGKSTVTSLTFNFIDEGEIILTCYSMDKKANQNDSSITTILNQKDSFRINIRSHVFLNYLKQKE